MSRRTAKRFRESSGICSVASELKVATDEMGIHEMTRAVFLDRDGVINRALERDGFPYAPTSLDEFEFIPKFPPRAGN